jgi:hypothetical protein
LKILSVFNVLARVGEDEAKFVVGCLEDAERAIQRTIDNLDVLHEGPFCAVRSERSERLEG